VLRKENQVHYVDIDLQYTSMLSNAPSFDDYTQKGLTVLRSGEHSIRDLFVTLLNSSGVEAHGLVVLDSLNTLQTLLQEKESPIDYLNANHKAAILITLAQQFADRHSKVLILASVVRSRPREVEGLEIWEKELSGGRMIRLKSDALVSVSSDTHDISSKIVSMKLTVEAVAQRSSKALEQGQSFQLRIAPFM
jgi:hypothetical protein